VDTWSGLRIEVSELREIVTRLLDDFEATHGEAVTLPEAYFYSVPFPELYDVLGSAPQLTVGQLTESWENLQREDASVQWELVWLGDVLKAIGHLE
jgi:hypothetical protein